MKDKDGKAVWPRWRDVFDLIEMPYLGAFICIVIAPFYIFSPKARREINSDRADGRFFIFIFIFIGTVLWIVGLYVIVMMLIDLLKT